MIQPYSKGLFPEVCPQIYILKSHFKALLVCPGKSQFPNGPRHEISNNVVCSTSRASDQPAHTHSLIRAFASRLNIYEYLAIDQTAV